jgi:20S proteasome subunit beta 1
MSEADAKAFVIKALSHAMARDASSGGCIRTVTIDKAGVRRDFIPGTDVPVCYGEMADPSKRLAQAAAQAAA